MAREVARQVADHTPLIPDLANIVAAYAEEVIAVIAQSRFMLDNTIRDIREADGELYRLARIQTVLLPDEFHNRGLALDPPCLWIYVDMDHPPSSTPGPPGIWLYQFSAAMTRSLLSRYLASDDERRRHIETVSARHSSRQSRDAAWDESLGPDRNLLEREDRIWREMFQH